MTDAVADARPISNRTFALRDLFWLMLFAAIAIGWRLDRQDAFKTLRALNASWPWDPDDPAQPWGRAVALHDIQKLDDEELRLRFLASCSIKPSPEDPRRRCEYAPAFLLELASRRMVEALREGYELAERRAFSAYVLENADLLTALRRAEEKPDPLQVRVELVDDESSRSSGHKLLKVWIENVDAEKSIRLRFGGDDSSRHERWRIELTSASGERVPDAFLLSARGDGPSQWKDIVPGAAAEQKYVLDPRQYVSPPPTGRYTLRVCHSNDQIARQRHIEGAVVWQSEPLKVEVENKVFNRPFSARTLALLLGAGIVAASVSVTVKRGRKSWLRRRDWLFLVAAIAAAIWWAGEQAGHIRSIERFQSPHSATWSLKKIDRLD